MTFDRLKNIQFSVSIFLTIGRNFPHNTIVSTNCYVAMTYVYTFSVYTVQQLETIFRSCRYKTKGNFGNLETPEPLLSAAGFF